MPALTNDHNAFGEGNLKQELIDEMLNVGNVAAEQDPWSDSALQAEIGGARLPAGIMGDVAEVPAAAIANRPPSGPTPTAVHPVQFMPLTPELPIADQGHGIELLMDVALEVSVELGRSHMSIGEILALRTGSVIELDKLAGEPVDVSVNGTLIARGEVVVVDEKFGVRITEVVSKARRLASVG